MAVTWTATYTITEREKRDALQSATLHSDRLVEFFERHAGTTFQYADDYIKTVRRLFRHDRSLNSVREYMTAVPPSSTILSHVTIMDAAGSPIFISTGREEKKIRPGIHARDRAYYKFQKSNQSDSVYISTARTGRDTGLMTVRLVRRITNAAGEFDGLLFAAIKVPQLLNFFESMRLGDNSSVTIVGLDKTIRIRQSQNGFEGIGKAVPQSQLWERLPQSATGSYRQLSVVDGVTRLWAYRKVGDFPIVAVIGTADEDTLAALSDIQAFRYAVAFLISAVGVVLVFFARCAIINTRLQTELEERKRSEAILLKAKEDAEQANAAKSEFLAVASHELRTPLTSIKGSLSLMVEGALGAIPENAIGMLNIANRNTNRLIALVNDILDMEKIESGSMEFNFQTVNLSNLVKEAVETNKGYAEEFDVDFILGTIIPEATVYGDADRLVQVVSNLLSNAAKFSPSGSEVTISVSRENGIATVSIRDRGVGIAEELRDHIFEKFTQADSSDARAKGGTGLGLNISKSIIENHGGGIDLRMRVVHFSSPCRSLREASIFLRGHRRARRNGLAMR